MNKADIKEIAKHILERGDDVVCVKRGMNGRLHQVAYTLIGEKFPRFEHFPEETFADALFAELIIGLAGDPRPRCALFKHVTLISVPPFKESSAFKSGGKPYLRLEFAGNHSLSFEYGDALHCIQDHIVIRKLMGEEGRPTPLN